MNTQARATIAIRLPAAAVAASLTLLLAGCATGAQPAHRTGDETAYAGSFAPAHTARRPRHRHSLHVGNAYFRTTTRTTEGAVTVEGHTIRYRAVAGLLIVHPAGWNDAERKAGEPPPGAASAHGKAGKSVPDEASMFYVAYFKEGARPAHRPITFLYNGGPGSSSVWLHMGAFGPRRVVTADHTHSPPAPYQLLDNHYSLLDATDLVFVDAPGTGFGRVRGKEGAKDFYGADQDVHAFSSFIMRFLSKYGRWNSPKYLLGESYGTPRSANLINVLETRDDTDFNGVILLSQILNFDDMTELAPFNPGIDLPYELALPSYAATAWYHHRLPGATQPLKPLLDQVERFAMTDYAQALRQGSTLSRADRESIAERMHRYTGLPVSYILKANLRITGPEFEHELLSPLQETTGRLDSRFSGPTLDPLSENAHYDPQAAAISSAYVSAFNDYVRKDLHYGMGMHYKPEISLFKQWSFRHKPPGESQPLAQALNVMPDLANAMKYDPRLKVMLNGGYFDLATPFYEGMYEMKHLPMPRRLQANIQYHFYKSGHMMYAHLPSLRHLHDNIAAFIAATDHQR